MNDNVISKLKDYSWPWDLSLNKREIVKLSAKRGYIYAVEISMLLYSKFSNTAKINSFIRRYFDSEDYSYEGEVIKLKFNKLDTLKKILSKNGMMAQ